MKTKLLLITLFFLCSYQAFSQAPAWAWAKQAGDVNFQRANAIATDHAGANITTGYYSGQSITFGATTLPQTLGCYGIFLVKYNSSGTLTWAKRAGGSAFNQAANSYAIATDTLNNIIIAGEFWRANSVFGSFTLTNDSNGYTRDVFIAKYDASGTVLWANRAGGKLNDLATSVATDASGNIFLTGTFESNSIIFGTDTLLNASPGSKDMFLVKYNSAGTIVWAGRIGGSSSDQSSSVATDPTGNILITGHCSDTVPFGNDTLTGNGIFIAKYNTSGTVLWAKGVSANSITSNSIASDGLGDVLITGTYSASSVTFGSTVLPNAGWEDVFLAKYSSSGSVSWAKKAGGNGNDYSYSVAVDAGGNSYIAGYHESNSIIFANDTLHTTGMSWNLFVAKYNSSGTALWGKGVTSSTSGSGAIAFAIALDASNNSYVAGTLDQCTLNFDAVQLTNSDFDNVLIAKLNANPVGIEDIEKENSFGIYPNPASNSFSIHIHSTLLKPQLEIFDLLGNKIYSEKLTSEKIYFNQPAGIYFVRVSDGEKMFTRKLVIE